MVPNHPSLDQRRWGFFRFPRVPGIPRITDMSQSYQRSRCRTASIISTTSRSGHSAARRGLSYASLAISLLVTSAPPVPAQATAGEFEVHPVAVWPPGPLEVIADVRPADRSGGGNIADRADDPLFRDAVGCPGTGFPRQAFGGIADRRLAVDRRWADAHPGHRSPPACCSLSASALPTRPTTCRASRPPGASEMTPSTVRAGRAGGRTWTSSRSDGSLETRSLTRLDWPSSPGPGG